MAFNGTGTFVRVHDWTTDLTNLVPVTASRADAEDDGFATGLSLTICRDGQSTTTARIPFAAGASAFAGTTASVSYAATNDANTGMYFPATDSWGLVAGGVATITSTATKVTIPVAIDFTGAAAPTTDDGAALGSTSQKWSDLFLASGAVINFNSGDVTVTHSANTLAFAGASTGYTFDAAGTFGGLLTVSTGGAAITGNSTVTGTLTSSGVLTVQAGGAAVTGNSTVTGTLTVSSTLVAQAAATVGTTLAVTGASTFTGVITGRIGLFHAREEQAANTQGGTFTSGAWRTRTLNTEKTNEIGATLGSNQITLLAGTYEVDASAPAFTVVRHKAKLVDVTNVVDLVIGTSENGNNGDGVQTRSHVRGRFTLAGTAAVELQHQCSTTVSTNGFGVASNFAVVEVYSEVLIRKVV